MQKSTIVSAVVGGVGAAGTYFFGGWSAVLQLLVIFIVTDYLTGISAAYIQGKLSSNVGFKGIAKKIAILVVVAIAHRVDIALGTSNDLLMSLSIYFYLSNEGISLFENLGKMGVPLPPQLKNALLQLKVKKDA